MKVSTQSLPESQLLLEIEVDQEQMERSLDKAYRRLVQRVDVPGFRKGKTPRHMLERHVGRDRLVREAVDLLIPEAYNQALDEHDIDPIDQPHIELVQDEPLAFKATVPLRPTIELGEYQELRLEREPVEVDEADVDRALGDLRQRYAVHEPVDRPLQPGDIVRADVRVEIEGREVFKDDDAEFRLREGATVLLPGFAEGLAGAAKGETREIPVTVPPGEQRLSGKSGAATVSVKEVKQETLPESDDAFAQQVGEGFPTLEALRERLRNDIRERMEQQAEEAYREKALTALVEEADRIEFPPVMVDREIEHLVRDQARASGQDIDSYLQLIKKSAEQLRQDLAPAAAERVKRSLALSGLAEREELRVQPEEVDSEVEQIVSASGPRAEQIRNLFASPEARTSLERSILTRKTMDRLMEIVGRDGAAPEAPAEAVKSEAESVETEEAL